MSAFSSAAFSTSACSTSAFDFGSGAASPASNSGGFFIDFDAYGSRRRKKRHEAAVLDDATQRIDDATAREIAELLRAQEERDEERADLSRLQRIADQYAGSGLARQGVPRSVSVAILKAHEERTANALRQMQREVERLMEEDELAVIHMLLDD